MQIMISLDSEAYTRKPEKGQIGRISSRIKEEMMLSQEGVSGND